MKMNTPSPLVPQGSLPDKGRSHFRITVLATLAVHVVLLCVLLIAGCNKKDPEQAGNTDNSGLVPAPQSTEPPAWPTNPIAPPPSPTQDPSLIAPPPSNHLVPPPSPVAPAVTDLAPPPTPAATGTEHTIVKGEVLETIARKYGVGWKAIEAANPGINPNRLKIGDKINIPPPKSGAAPVAASNGDAASADGGVKSYKVKSGDNLLKIAKNFGTTPRAIRAANGLRTDQIKVGQTLKIPVKVAAPVSAPETLITPAPVAPAVPPVPPPGNP